MSKPKQPSMMSLLPHQWVEMLKPGHSISKNHIRHEFGERAKSDKAGAQKILDALVNGILPPKEIKHLQHVLKQAGADNGPKKRTKKEGLGVRRRDAA